MYDAIVVGARCAGASTAMQLARRGRKVLMIDRERFPSDKEMSTHLLWHAGADCLRRWGLLDKLEAAGCRPQDEFLLDLGEIRLRGKAELRGCAVPAAYGPRRIVLDGILVEAAKAAGAELAEGCNVRELIREGDRIAGVVYCDADGNSREVRASIVIGADGLNSTVAKLVGAMEYNVRPKAERTYFAYFDGVDLPLVEFHSRPGRMVFAWGTQNGEIVAGFCCRAEDSADRSGGIEKRFWAEIDACAPSLSQRLKLCRRTTPIRSGSVRGFMRPAGGLGWALVGDAGVNLDPITAAGITHALVQAEKLAEAVDTGLDAGDLDAAIARFREWRDARIGPMYEFTSEMAKLDPEPPEEIIHLFVGLAGSQSDTDAYFGVFAQTVPVTDFFAPENQSRIIARGRAAMEGATL